VHGGGNDALFALTGLIAELAGRGFEVFSFDVDGHGRFSTTLLSESSVRECVPAGLDAWTDRDTSLPLHAVGVSLGGSLLLHSLQRLTGRLTSATLMCAPLRIELSWRAIRRELGPPMLRTVWRGRERYGLTGLVPSFGPFRRDLYPLRLAETPGPGAFGYVIVLNKLLSDLDLPAAAERAETPVLLVYGGRDRLVPAVQGRHLAELLTASELLVLDRETHLTTPLAPRAMERLLDWIEEHHRKKHRIP
jgi:alpha-beta hydrolase superfamily lysophospholipase